MKIGPVEYDSELSTNKGALTPMEKANTETVAVLLSRFGSKEESNGV